MALLGRKCINERSRSSLSTNATAGMSWRAPVAPLQRCGRCTRVAAAADNGIEDDSSSGLGKLRLNKREQELPEALRGLEISDDGFLIDTKTGKVINEFGATRFDVAVRALRGELDPAPWVEVRELACLVCNLTWDGAWMGCGHMRACIHSGGPGVHMRTHKCTPPK